MVSHPTIEELSRWRHGGMEGEEVITIARHLATCEECATAAAQRMDLSEAAAALAADIVMDDIIHPDVERDLFVYADGTGTPEQRAALEEHLALCAICAETVADLRAIRPPRHPVRPWMIALAASIVIALLSGYWRTPRTPPAPVEKPHPSLRTTVPTPRSGDASTALLASVRAGASIGMPDILRLLRPKRDVLRGTTGADSALSPVGVVLKNARPQFTWPAAKGSRSTVQVFAEDEEIAHSGDLAATQWRPEQTLARGITYTWNVRVEQDGISQILPSSPAPTARFHILDAVTLAALEAAVRDHPDDHLLLGIVHAQAGLESEARMHLRLITDPTDAVVARRVLREIDSWPRP